MKLKEKDLENVSGGYDYAGAKERKFDGYHFSGVVDKYHPIVGKYYYLCDDHNRVWYYGKLTKSYEKSKACHTVRTHKLAVEQYCYQGEFQKIVVGKEQEFCGDIYTLYEYMIEE